MEQQPTERIEAYLLGHMRPSEKQVFEQELKTDAALATALAIHRKFIHGVEEHAFREMLQGIFQETGTPEIPADRVLPFSRVWYFAMAAAIILLFGMLWLLMPKAEPQYLAAISPIELDPGLPTELRATHSLDFAEGMNAYKLQEYPTARTYWAPLLAQAPQNDTLLFYLSQIDLAVGKTQEAIQKLERLRKMSDSAFQNKSTWYLALGYLQVGNIPEAKGLLVQLTYRQGFRSAKAKELLEGLATP